MTGGGWKSSVEAVMKRRGRGRRSVAAEMKRGGGQIKCGGGDDEMRRVETKRGRQGDGHEPAEFLSITTKSLKDLS